MAMMYDSTVSATALLQHLSTEELKEILNNDSKVDELVNDLDQMKQLQQDKKLIMASNKSLAEYNLTKEPQINKAKNELLEQYNNAAEVAEKVEEKKAALEGHNDGQSLDTVLALLQAACAEAEEESESLTEKFLQGAVDVDDFLEEYHRKRTLAHLRRVKVEKMTELVRNPQRRASDTPLIPGARRPAPPPPSYPNYMNIGGPPPSLPYPMMPTGMPQPLPRPWPNA